MVKAILCSMIYCTAFSLNAGAQSAETRQPAETQNSAEVRQVEAAVEFLRKAMVSGDRQQLEGITAAELSYGHSSGTIEDKSAFVENIVSGKSDFVTLELNEQTVRVSGKTAVVRHLLSADTNDSGRPGHVELGVLLVWQKQHGKWKLLARQAYKL